MAQFKILSLDGGGSWALIQARALIKIYGPDIRGHELLSQFDLVAANSGGTLTLGGMLEDMPLSAVLQLFLDNADRHAIFVAESFWQNPVVAAVRALLGIGPRYNTAAKLVGLRKLFPRYGDTKLVDLPERIRMAHGKTPSLMISAFDYDRERETFFRSNPLSLAGSFAPQSTPTLAEAVHASTNAPVNYFNEPAMVQGKRYWDGGVGSYNNPILIAVVEAIANGARPSDIVALSLGTATMFLPMASDYPQTDPALVQAATDQKLTNDIKKLALSILDDPPDDASFIAHVNLGGALPAGPDSPITQTRIVRLNPLIQPVRKSATDSWAVPDGLSHADFVLLGTLELDAIEPDQVAVIEKLCAAWIAGAVWNQPIRANRQTLACEIGQRIFSQAYAQWLSITSPPPPTDGTPVA